MKTEPTPGEQFAAFLQPMLDKPRPRLEFVDDEPDPADLLSTIVASARVLRRQRTPTAADILRGTLNELKPPVTL